MSRAMDKPGTPEDGYHGFDVRVSYKTASGRFRRLYGFNESDGIVTAAQAAAAALAPERAGDLVERGEVRIRVDEVRVFPQVFVDDDGGDE